MSSDPLQCLRTLGKTKTALDSGRSTHSPHSQNPFPLSVRSMYARAYRSHPHTACTVLHMHANNARRLHHMVNEPAELQGYLSESSKVSCQHLPTKLLSDRLGTMCSAKLHPGCQSHCLLDSSICICIRRDSKTGGDQYQRGRFAGQNSKLSQKLNITLQERPWRLVGVKVVGNPLSVL